MQLFSQRDPAWRGVHVGTSGKTLGQIGCTVTGLAMLSTYFGIGMNPPSMAHRLRFTSKGLVYWSSVKFPGWGFQRREYKRDDAAILHAINHPDKAVLLEVANHSHWVVGIGVTWPYNIFRIADPIDGKKATMSRYQDNITGAAFFERA